MRELRAVIDEIFDECKVPAKMRECLSQKIEKAMAEYRHRLNEKFQMKIGNLRAEIERSLYEDGSNGQ